MAKKLVYLSKIYIIHAVRDSWFICSRGRLTSTRQSLPCRAWGSITFTLGGAEVQPGGNDIHAIRLSNQNFFVVSWNIFSFQSEWQRGSTSGRLINVYSSKRCILTHRKLWHISNLARSRVSMYSIHCILSSKWKRYEVTVWCPNFL